MLRIFTTSATRQLCQRPSLPTQYRQLSSAAPSKIGILPFAEQRKEALRLLGARIYAETTDETSSSFGQIFKSTASPTTQVQEETEVNSVECVYLPYWAMDAKVVIGVNTPSGSAKLHTYFDSFPIPAHSDPGLQLLSLTPPATKSIQYQPFDTQTHLGEVDGQVPRVLPFLFTPATLARAAAEIQVSNVFKGIPLLGFSKTAIYNKAVRDKAVESIGRGEKQAHSNDVLQFDNAHFSVDYYSCSPLLVPIRIVQLANSSPSISADRRPLTMAVPAWDMLGASPTDIEYHYDSPKSSDSTGARQVWTRGHFQEKQDTVKLFCNPRIPIASRLQSLAERFAPVPSYEKALDFISNVRRTIDAQAKGSLRKLFWIAFLSFFTKMWRFYLGNVDFLIEEESDRDAVEIASIRHVMRERLHEHIDKALLLDLGTLQAQTNVAYDASSAESQETEVNMGSYIDWDDPLITAPSGSDGKSSSHDHRAFFEQDMKVQQAEIDHLREYRSGKEASDTAAIVAEESAKRNRLAPPEVTSWLDSLPPEIHKATKK